MDIKEERELRKRIKELRESLEAEVDATYANYEGSKRDNLSIAFSYEIEGFGGAPTRKFYEMLSNYGITEYNTDTELKLRDLGRELLGMKRFCESARDNLSGRFKRERTDVALEEIRQRLAEKIRDARTLGEPNGDEWQKRLATLELDEDSRSSRADAIKALDAFIHQLDQEIDAVKGAMVISRSDELGKMYESLIEMEANVTEMQQDREAVKHCGEYISSLGKIYEQIESINEQLKDKDLSEADRSKLKATRISWIGKLYEVIDVAQYPHRGVEKIKNLFSEDGELLVGEEDVLPALREGLEDLEFEVNSRNGKINESMLKRDMNDIARAEAIDNLTVADNISDPEARKAKMFELAKSEELKGYKKMLDLKRLLEEIIQAIEEWQRLFTRKEEILEKLKDKDLKDDERESLERELGEVVGKLQGIIKKIAGLQKKAKGLANNIGIDNFESINLNKVSEIKEKGVKPLENSLQTQRTAAHQRKEKACSRYGVDPTKGYDEIKTNIRARVEQIKGKKHRSSSDRVSAPRPLENSEPPKELPPPVDPRRVASPSAGTVSSTNRDTTISSGAPRSFERPGGSSVVTPFDLSSSAPRTIPPTSFGGEGATVPRTATSRVTGSSVVPPSATPEVVSAPRPPRGAEVDDSDPDVDAPEVLDAVVRRLMKDKAVREVVKKDSPEVRTNPTRVELGVVYRYERGPKEDELYFVQESLEDYLEDPKGKLEDVLDGLRERFETELGSKKAIAEFLDLYPDCNKFLGGLVSKWPHQRWLAKKKFMTALEEIHGEEANQAYVSMALALQSAIEPEKIDEALSRYSQPYTQPSDMNRYVRTTKRGNLGIPRELLTKAQSESRAAERAARETRNINLTPDSDGTLRLFRYSSMEMGERSERRDENRPKDGRGSKGGRGPKGNRKDGNKPKSKPKTDVEH